MTTTLVWFLLGAASILVLLCSVGIVSMRDPLQQLHFVSPPTTVSAALIAAAVLIDDHDKVVGGKAALLVLVLAAMNGVATHATARATRVRQHGTWLPVSCERVPILGTHALVAPIHPASEEGSNDTRQEGR